MLLMLIILYIGLTMVNNICITASGTTTEEIWKEVRSQLGPTNVDDPNMVELYNHDLQEYTDWISGHGSVPFDKWLIWRIRVGTSRYGNLPKDKERDGKIGHCWAPCPYSTQSTELRTRHLLRLSDSDSLPIKVDHTSGGITYYMTTSARGSLWGYECSYIGCTHYILNGQKYFFT